MPDLTPHAHRLALFAQLLAACPASEAPEWLARIEREVQEVRAELARPASHSWCQACGRRDDLHGEACGVPESSLVDQPAAWFQCQDVIRETLERGLRERGMALTPGVSRQADPVPPLPGEVGR